VDDGFLGKRPVGVPKVRAVLGLDYRVATVPGLSVDLKTVFSGSAPARSRLSGAASQLMVDPSQTVDIGVRYGFRLASHKVTARAQIQNVFNSYDWLVNSSETLGYSPQRRAKLSFALVNGPVPAALGSQFSAHLLWFQMLQVAADPIRFLSLFATTSANGPDCLCKWNEKASSPTNLGSYQMLH